jgi:pyruvate/2-oxoglutarate dehydrogenase complex dihydrolipoamide dehydrogenase (E3) component
MRIGAVGESEPHEEEPMSIEPQKYDAIIIGSGQAAKPLAIDLAGAGRTVAVIERKFVGGTCINVGCTPTKTMVASARIAHLARRSAEYGVHGCDVTVALEEVRKRKQAIVESFRGGSQRRLESTPGVDLIFGDAHFVDARTVEVNGADGNARQLRAPTIFIHVGARPAVPSLEGISDVPFLDSTSIMEIDHVPEHLVVLGGGYIGLEFGQMFRRFGSRVTVVQRGEQLLAREDADVASTVADILREDGIEILLDAQATRVSRSDDGGVALAVTTRDGEVTVHGTHLLAAAGRTPNTDTLNLEAAGIHTDRNGFVSANERLETNVEGIYALGDVKGGPQFTHISYDDYRIAKANLLDGASATTHDRLIPYTVFIDPQLGRVGLSTDEARATGRNIRVAKMPMTHVARALEVDETRGFMKAIVDEDTKEILGCAVLGIEGGEIMSMLEIAMMGRVPYTALRDGVFAHPTLAEALNNLFFSFES